MTNKSVNRVCSRPPYVHGGYLEMCPRPYDPRTQLGHARAAFRVVHARCCRWGNYWR
jgi:hypothetical protein